MSRFRQYVGFLLGQKTDHTIDGDHTIDDRTIDGGEYLFNRNFRSEWPYRDPSVRPYSDPGCNLKFLKLTS